MSIWSNAVRCYFRDLELVEDALQDALVLALEHWPVDGVPPNPGAWITPSGLSCASGEDWGDIHIDTQVLNEIAPLAQDRGARKSHHLPIVAGVDGKAPQKH